MRYVSTRSAEPGPGLPFCDILLDGLAPDGGLYLPQSYPQLSAETLTGWGELLESDGYAAVAFEVLRLFVDDIPDADLRAICERAYAVGTFGDPVVPVAPVTGDLWLLKLSEGPTAAFKDMAMQLLGQLFEYELERRGRTLTILGATSGDTGSAAEYAMRGLDRITVFMLSPQGRMSPFQQAQMFSLDDPHIINLAVEGVFDDCQDLVKAVMSDAAFKATHSIGAVNSINWGRVVAQVVYYVVGYLRVHAATGAERVSFAVPTGNFGNICAAHVARMMGLPVDALILATNENNVLDEFFRTGVYRVRSGAAETSSPSMDISKASNFERFVFDLLGRDGVRTAELFGPTLLERGLFDLSGTPEFAAVRDRYGFVSGTSTHADRLATIAALETSDGVVIDPHTADAVKVARDLRAELAGPIVVTETALPVKFSATIVEALGREPERPDAFAGIEDLPRHVLDIPADAGVLKAIIADRLG
ncbi:threonine synthase [Micropruina sonneratiae]|uniref:threonine synthase n=1 Tax=Micropruina sonneratiae TaxID=2986940 RepID=UPI002226F79A|nr:threonine synthase [Micropruina sp. KQZ13P-5]MCW3159372.1 threonine synthase [Micropruina sp. KQZ13P-5]